MARIDRATVYLDPAEAAAAREVRRHKFHTSEVPRLRFIGFAFNAIGIAIHNWLIYGTFDLGVTLWHTSLLLGYSTVAWAVLALAWSRVKVVNLGDVFLGLDLLPMAYVVYVTGADKSFIWFVFVARAADQVAISFRHALVFSHLSTAAYVSLIAWVSFGEGRPVNWDIEIAKIAFLYFLSLYITMSARAVAARRRKFDQARRLAEQAVRDANDRRRDLEHALSRLEAANRTKSEFLANVSHEVRTPLNSVIGNADLLLDTPLSSDQREMLGVMRDSAESLTRIVDDILDLSKMEAQRLPLESIPLRIRDVAGITVRMFAARAHQKGLVLVCDVHRKVPEVVLGDPHRLRQVLTNLVNNAVKFTERGEVVLSIDVDDEGDDRMALRFAVRDTGIGIPKSRQAAIFEAFTQADGSDTRRFGGTGLGLTIAAQLVSLMQGRLWVESKEGQGSQFKFVAWFGTTPSRSPAPPWGPEPLHVLVAHSHAPTRSAIVELLAAWSSVRVTDAAGGRAAMAALEVARDARQTVDVLLVEAALGALDGFELAARARVTPGLVGHVIVLLPTTQLATGSERAASVGARYLTTPIIWPTLAEAITAARSGQPVPPPAAAKTRTGQRPLRVLVVDDHVVNQAVASAMLRKWGHAVATAYDGQEAVDKTARERFDLVLMDLQMPTLDGLQATRMIRAREQAAGHGPIPIVAMTARAMTEDRDHCRQAGMNGFVSKPIDQQELFDILDGVAAGLPRETSASAPPTQVTPLISDPETSRHVAQLFLDTAPGQLDRLRQAVGAADAALIASLAHALRGAMSHFKGGSIDHLERLEELGRAGTLAETPALFARAEADVASLLATLRRA